MTDQYPNRAQRVEEKGAALASIPPPLFNTLDPHAVEVVISHVDDATGAQDHVLVDISRDA
jgi:hypothetical protein